MIQPQKENYTIQPHRLIFLFEDNLCIYPAQRFDSLEVSPPLNAKNYLAKLKSNKNNGLIQRGVIDNQSSSKNTTVFWSPLSDP
jgi:hypothetical protein